MTNGSASHVGEGAAEAAGRSTAEQAELACIGDQIESAQTLAEVMEVTAALRA